MYGSRGLFACWKGEYMRRITVLFLCAAAVGGPGFAQSSFVNFETPPVSPMDLSPDGATLAVCNLPDNRVEIFSVTTGIPAHQRSIPVGLDPASARFRTNTELWVVNRLSDSLSVIDLATGHVKATLHTHDEPADVVFAGAPQRAFVSCSQTHTVLVFNPADLSAAPQVIVLEDDHPRAMAVNPDRTLVYVCMWEANKTHILGGSAEDTRLIPFPPNAVSDPRGPYGGVDPPPQLPEGDDFINFIPPNESLPPAPRTGLVMVTGGGIAPDGPLTHPGPSPGRGQDGQQVSWTPFIEGDLAAASGRITGWAPTAYAVSVINANTLAVQYYRYLNDVNMSIDVHPETGRIVTAGVRAHNYIRFEPNQAAFVEQFFYWTEPGTDRFLQGRTLNAHLGRKDKTIPEVERRRAIADPRSIKWAPDGSKFYVVGMGTNNMAIFDAITGNRIGRNETVELGRGPVGLVVDGARNRLYILNRFDATISVVNTDSEVEVARVSLFDPTPEVIRRGRPHFYDAHETSGTGAVACNSCHIDARTDRVGWDLGNPAGDMKPLSAIVPNPGGGIPGLAEGLEDFHPVKGQMVTQTLQDIIGKEPLHWRGDRTGLEEFNPAFIGLLGDDEMLTAQEMQEFEDFLATIHFPPNPYRNFDNSLPANLELPDLLRTSGVFGPAGQPMPHGNALRGLDLFRNALPRDPEVPQLTCATCHTLPTGMGTNHILVGGEFVETEDGPKGEKHHALVSIVGFTQKTFKVPHLRSVREKLGFQLQSPTSRQGFGFMHDGSIDSLTRLLAEGHFSVARSEQDVADLAALLLAFSGSDFPGDPDDIPESPSQDAHAAVGYQVTVANAKGAPAELASLLDFADSGKIDVVVRYRKDGRNRGAVYVSSDRFDTDMAAESMGLAELMALANPGAEQTYTAVPRGSGTRIGVDRDEDGLRDFDEQRDLDPRAAGIQNPFDEANPDATGDDGDLGPDGVADGDNDFDGDTLANAEELALGTSPLLADTDGDEFADNVELDAGTDPLDANDFPGAGEGEGEGEGEGPRPICGAGVLDDMIPAGTPSGDFALVIFAALALVWAGISRGPRQTS